MRPVQRGDFPVDDTGDQIVFRDYKDARDFLIERVGDYCSYCEVALHTQVDVEHVLPKDEYEDLELDWDNFLVACRNCNSIKGADDPGLDACYWPHLDNTARVLVYRLNSPPMASDDPSIDADRAKATIDLTGLDRVPPMPEHPRHPNYSTRDRRWLKRRNAWKEALRAAELIQLEDTASTRTLAVQIAVQQGFWSIWMTVFHQDHDMKNRLFDAFPGTARDCFDAQFAFVPRPGSTV